MIDSKERQRITSIIRGCRGEQTRLAKRLGVSPCAISLWFKRGGSGLSVDKQILIQQRAAELSRPRTRQNAQKRRAWVAIRNAIKSGLITKPTVCESCGESPERSLHAHHRDYSKPLEVIWLCGHCHGLVHIDERQFIAGVSSGQKIHSKLAFQNYLKSRIPNATLPEQQENAIPVSLGKHLKDAGN